MRTLFVTSEMFPLVKTGGLADVSAALPQALLELGVDVRVMLPAYPQALAAAVDKQAPVPLPDFLDCGTVNIIPARTPDTDVPLLLVDCPALYDRAGGIYQDENGDEWGDNALRFGLLNHAAAYVGGGEFSLWQPDVVHAQDWHTGLIPLLMRNYARQAPTLFTLHNMAFQGLFPMDNSGKLGVGPEFRNVDGVEFYGRLCFLKTGIRYAKAVNTVSPNYAREIVTPEFGCGLDGLLRARGDLVGILNGIDTIAWNPAGDPFLTQRYSADDLSGKQVCKLAVQKELGLTPDAEVPLIAFISRLTTQKLADVVADAIPQMVAMGTQFALVGNGDKELERQFVALARQYPGQVAAKIGYNEEVAHRLYAGSDMMLAPARFEPCGLTPLYAMRYGTVPVVRPVGGLADTIVSANSEVPNPEATGFSFSGESTGDLLACLEQAVEQYRAPLAWRRIQLRGMKRDCGWETPAREYSALYHQLSPGSGTKVSLAGLTKPSADKVSKRA